MEGSQQETEEYYSSIQLFAKGGSIRKIPFAEITGVSLTEPKMQEELEASLTAALGARMPKPPPPPRDYREVIGRSVPVPLRRGKGRGIRRAGGKGRRFQLALRVLAS